MSNTHSFAAIGMFALIMVWGLFVQEHNQKAIDLRGQESVVVK